MYIKYIIFDFIIAFKYKKNAISFISQFQFTLTFIYIFLSFVT